MISDHQRVEFLFFPQMLYSIVNSGTIDKSHPDFARCNRHILAARDAALHGCDDRRRGNLLRRVHRLDRNVMQHWVGGEIRCDKVGLMVWDVLQAVLDQEYLVLHEGSDVAEALTILTPILEHALEIETLRKSAEKQAPKLLARLQAEGYFLGVTMTDRQEAA